LPTAVFYVSGHGFGHAARSIEIINAIARKRPDLRIVVKTTAARWLLDLTLTTPFEHESLQSDTGMVQIDSLHLDERESIRRAAIFHETLGERAAREAEYLRATSADLVVGDIPPLAFAAAEAADLPGVAVGNFTWDWIYAAYSEHLGEAPSLLPAIRAAYRSASLALRLPMFGGFEVFGPAVRDIPLVARRSRRDRESVRRWLGAPTDRPLVLVSFGGHNLRSISLERVDALGTYTIMTTVPPGEERIPRAENKALLHVREDAVYASGFRYEDLVAAADVVVTKPGYSIIAEAAAHETAVLYTSRGRFVEYDVLVSAMPELIRCRFVSHEALFGGRWHDALDGLLASPRPASKPAVDGADVAADILANQLP
jgi:L-arabinokinase